jgi:uncharacterized RDD family membrane protein YckC
MASERPPSNSVQRAVAPIARAGWRGARGVARRLGLDRAMGQAVDKSVDRALDSETAAKATERLLQTDTANRVWDKVLESDEAQKLVERVAEAPEVRAAITAQGVGVIEDFRRGVRRISRSLDTRTEGFARRLLRRQLRDGRPIYAGAASRILALLIDAGIVYGSLLLVTTLLALLVSALESGDQSASTGVIAIGAALWVLIAGAYLVIFWSGAGRTPGMSFIGLRILSEDGTNLRLGRAIRRAIWLPLAALPLFLGYWGILFGQERRGWPDRRGRTYVCYADPELDQDLV